jgi:hypothetical protein
MEFEEVIEENGQGTDPGYEEAEIEILCGRE